MRQYITVTQPDGSLAAVTIDGALDAAVTTIAVRAVEVEHALNPCC